MVKRSTAVPSKKHTAMIKAIATRKDGIIEKLDFAEAERTALHHALFDTYATVSSDIRNWPPMLPHGGMLPSA